MLDVHHRLSHIISISMHWISFLLFQRSPHQQFNPASTIQTIRWVTKFIFLVTVSCQDYTSLFRSLKLYTVLRPLWETKEGRCKAGISPCNGPLLTVSRHLRAVPGTRTRAYFSIPKGSRFQYCSQRQPFRHCEKKKICISTCVCFHRSQIAGSNSTKHNVWYRPHY